MSGQEFRKVFMDAEVYQGPVVQPGPFEISAVQAESEGFYEVEFRPDGRARSGDVARILGNQRLMEDDIQVEHYRIDLRNPRTRL